MSRLRIIVADANPPTLRSLASLLAAECEVVASAADVASLLALVRQHKPDMVVVDIRTRKLDGIEVASALAKYPEPPPILICAVETDPEIIEAARRAGSRLTFSTPASKCERRNKASECGSDVYHPHEVCHLLITSSSRASQTRE